MRWASVVIISILYFGSAAGGLSNSATAELDSSRLAELDSSRLAELDSSELARLDYWEKDPQLWAKIVQKRQILVSAKNEEGQTQSKGVGLVKAPVDRVWAFATDPEKIKKSSRFLKDFTWNQETGDVLMQIEILYISYQLKGKAVKMPDPLNPKIEFQVFEGDLVPFTATLEIRASQAQEARQGAPAFPANQTLVRISGASAKDRYLSWPLRVGLEAVLHRTAGALREAVEAESH